jgi:hypothetical protein
LGFNTHIIDGKAMGNQENRLEMVDFPHLFVCLLARLARPELLASLRGLGSAQAASG